MKRQDLIKFLQQDGISKKGIATEAGIDPATLWRIEQGQRLTNRTARKLLPVMKKYGYK
jgi:transcriptional regulator with XRE-family HTH domain